MDLEDEKCIREYSVVCESMEGEVLEMKQIDFIKIMKKEDVLIWNSIVFESRNKKFRLNQRVFEYFNVVSEKKTLVNFQNGRKLQELFKVKTQESTQNFNSNGFQKIESEISRFNYQQAELKNCQKLKSLRLFTKLNEFEEAYDKIQGKKISNSYTSSLIGEFKEKIDQIEKKHFTHRYSKGENEFKSNSIEFSNNPLLLKNIGYFSPKYTRIVNIIHRKRKLPSYNLSKKP